MAAKRYYWLKLPEGFFRQKTIKKLRKIAGGDTYTVIYLKMLLVSIKQDGRIYFDGVEDDFYDELALELDEDVENVKVTVLFLLRQGLMVLIDETEYLLTESTKMTGSESSSAERMRRLRDKKASQCDTLVTEQLHPCDVEKEIEKEIEKESEKENRENTLAHSSDKQNYKQEPEADVAAIILNDGTEWRPDETLFAEYVKLYPNVDVKQQFNEMRSWCLSNQEKRKTKRGVKRFVNSWLGREQDKRRNGKYGSGECSYGSGQPYRKPGAQFHDFEQRKYDYDELMRKISSN